MAVVSFKCIPDLLSISELHVITLKYYLFSFGKKNDVGLVFGANVALSVIVKGKYIVYSCAFIFICSLPIFMDLAVELIHEIECSFLTRNCIDWIIAYP